MTAACGRHIIQDCDICAFHLGVNINLAKDIIYINNCNFTWGGFQSAITTAQKQYYREHSIGINVVTSDGLTINSCIIYGGYIGMQLNGAIDILKVYGTQFDGLNIGISNNAETTNTTMFNNCSFFQHPDSDTEYYPDYIIWNTTSITTTIFSSCLFAIRSRFNFYKQVERLIISDCEFRDGTGDFTARLMAGYLTVSNCIFSTSAKNGNSLLALGTYVILANNTFIRRGHAIVMTAMPTGVAILHGNIAAGLSDTPVEGLSANIEHNVNNSWNT